MKASSSSRVSTRWVFGLLGAVLFCNFVLLHFMQQGPTQDTQQEVDEARQRAQEAGRLAQSLYHDNEALQQRVRLLNRERDSLLAGQPAGTSSAGSSSSGSGSSTDTRTVARLIEEVKDRSGEMARQLQREASIALINHIHRNQNPPSCLPSSSTRFMVCPMMDTCGFGCAFHHATYCFIAALRDNRTVVFEDDAHHWQYAKGCAEAGRAPGWECYFEPLSSCHYADIESSRTGKDWPQWRPNSSDKVTYVPFWSRPERGQNFFPWASTDGDQTNDPFFIPKVAKDILGLVPHGEIGDLRAWFVGQLEKYMLRPNKLTGRALREIHAELARVPGSNEKSAPVKADPDDVGEWWKADWEFPEDHHARSKDARDLTGEWRHPIAAMHVRRTDHGSEAPFRDVAEYVKRIEKWWDEYRARPENRLMTERLRIYLATDEPKVIEEAGKMYPQFVFLTTSHGGRSSGEGERAGTAHTQNLLSDLFHLAKADFFVGTASSQVSRMAYERQQTHSLDRHNWRTFVSLDSPWYFP
jgi:glycoprotein 6-alpha-L-fucosyltransferase